MSGLFGGASKATTHATRAMGIDFQGAQYGQVVPVVYGQNKVAGNCIWYGDFQSHAQQQKSGKGGGGGSTTNYTYSASAQMGICEGPGIALVTVYDGNSVVNLSSINYAFAAGNFGQAAWSHLSGDFALGYSLTAVFSFQNLDLGSQATLPNYNYEVKALKPFSGSIPDANPKEILSDICSDPYHGISFPWLGSLTQYSNYCVANGLFLSPVYDQQASAQQNLSDLLKYTNTDGYYSDDQLKVVPRGDVAVTGNGVTYTPNVTPLVDLDTSDFLVNGSGDLPVQLGRKAPQDSLNVVRVEFKDRSNTYHDSGVVGAIDFDVIANGERSDNSETVNGCTSGSVARFIAQNLVQRAFYVRNTYTFRLPWNYCYLEPTDLVTLTDASLGLSKTPVRITSVEEDENSTLTIEVEEWPEGIGHSAIYGTQSNGGTNVDQNADPGAVNPPYLFRGPGFLVGNNTPEIWCAVNGSGAMWAACEVYLSHDGSSYTYCGTVASQARYGALTTALPAGSDPDTTHTPSVQLYAPAQLLGGSQTDADNFVTLAMVDTEVFAYENATLTGTNLYQLGYLRRGGYGSGNVAHAIGAPFVRLDESIFRMPVDPSLIGSTVYLKFLSLNAFGRTPRTLADETAYQYVVGTNVELPDVPDVPAGFAVAGVADGVSITWTNDNPAAVGCTSIEFATAAAGPFTVLAQVGPTTTGYHHSFTTGATYYYRARARGPLPQSGWSAYTDTFNSTGVDVSAIAANASSAVTTANNALLTANQALGNTPYLQNPYFTTGDLTGWSSDFGGWVFQSGTNGPATGSTTYAKRTGSSTHPSEAIRNSGKIPVYPGARIKAQCAVKGYNTPNGTCGVRISWRDASDTELSTTDGTTTTGNGTNGTYVTGTAPANAMFAHIECAANNHTTGTYSVDNFAAWALADSMDQVPDSTTRFAAAQAGADKTSSNTAADTTKVNGVAASSISPISGLMPAEAGAEKTTGKSITVLTGRTLDNIADSTTYRRVGAGYVDSSNRVITLWDGTTVRQGSDIGSATSRALAGFDSAGALVQDKTSLARLSGRTLDNIGDSASYVRTPVRVQSLVQNGDFETGGAATFPPPGWVAGRLVLGGVVSSPGYDTSSQYSGTRSLSFTAAQFNGYESAQTFQVTPGDYYAVGGALAIGAGAQALFGIYFLDASNAAVGHVTIARTVSGFAYLTAVGQVPANAVTGVLVLGQYNAGSFVVEFDALFCARCASYDTALAIAGSGQQIGDLRNVPPVGFANYGGVWTGQTISYSATPTSATVTVTASTLQLGGVPISYGASSITVSGSAGVTNTLYLYYVDPTFAGGSHNVQGVWTGDANFANVIASAGNVLVGAIKIAFPASGSGSGSGGSGTGGGPAGGGGLTCVADGMFIGDGRRAGDADVGDPFDCIDLPTAAGKHTRALQGLTRGIEECVRMITSDGCALVCSISTPFDLPDGRTAAAPQMLGEYVITDLGAAQVTSLALVGPLPVTRAHLGGVSYAAGADPQRRIYSHNVGIAKP